jgi:hypothetical protein
MHLQHFQYLQPGLWFSLFKVTNLIRHIFSLSEGTVRSKFLAFCFRLTLGTKKLQVNINQDLTFKVSKCLKLEQNLSNGHF